MFDFNKLAMTALACFPLNHAVRFTLLFSWQINVEYVGRPSPQHQQEALPLFRLHENDTRRIRRLINADQSDSISAEECTLVCARVRARARRPC